MPEQFCTGCGAARLGEEPFCTACGQQFDVLRVNESGRVDEPAHTSRALAFVAVMVAVVVATAGIAIGVSQGNDPADRDGSASAPVPTTSSPVATRQEVAVRVTPSATVTEDAQARAAELLARQKRQAKALVKIIKQSAKARDKVRNGVQLVESCDNPTRGAALLREAVGIRAAVLSQLVDVDVSALPDGKKAVAALKDAQQESLRPISRTSGGPTAVTGTAGSRLPLSMIPTTRPA